MFEGTHSTSQERTAVSLEDIRKTVDAVLQHGFAGGPTSVRVCLDKYLEPHLERDTFSGGFNATRRERNLRALSKSAQVVVLGENVFAPGHAVCVMFPEARPKRRHPAMLEWIRRGRESVATS